MLSHSLSGGLQTIMGGWGKISHVQRKGETHAHTVCNRLSVVDTARNRHKHLKGVPNGAWSRLTKFGSIPHIKENVALTKPLQSENKESNPPNSNLYNDPQPSYL